LQNIVFFLNIVIYSSHSTKDIYVYTSIKTFKKKFTKEKY
jgi:hypothetical protein